MDKYLNYIRDSEEEKAEEFKRNFLYKKHKEIQVDILEFYPELKDINIYSNYDFGCPIYTQLPFAGKLLVPIHPFKNPLNFKEKYGYSLSEIIEIAKWDMIIPIFDCDLHRYENLKYFVDKGIKKIKDKIIVSSIRNSKYFEAIDEKRYFQSLEIGEKIFRHKINNNEKDRIYGSKFNWTNIYNKGNEAFETTTIKRFARLNTIYPDFEIFIKENPSPYLISLLDVLLIDPLTKSVKGFFRINKKEYNKIVNNLLDFYIKNIPKVNIEIFDKNIATFIIDYCKINYPLHISLNELEKIMSDEMVEMARMTLKKLSESYDIKEKEIIKSIWQELSKKMCKVSKQYNLTKKVISGCLLGVLSIIPLKIMHPIIIFLSVATGAAVPSITNYFVEKFAKHFSNGPFMLYTYKNKLKSIL